MRIVVFGTGLLGGAIVTEAVTRGHEVVTVAKILSAPLGLAPAESLVADVEEMADSELDTLLAGADAVVIAFGADDRERVPHPAYEFFRRHLIEPTARVAAAARRVGAARLVMLGSYFSTFDRRHPRWRLADRHPYIAARRAQAARVLAACPDVTAVTVLEIPYVFGLVPGVTPIWKANFFDQTIASPVLTVPRGRNATVAPEDVAGAALAVLEGRTPPARRPVATGSISFHRMAELLNEELALGRRVVSVPSAVLVGPLVATYVAARLRGRDTGLNLVRLPGDILDRDLVVDLAEGGTPYGLAARDIEPAVRETIRACYPDRARRP